jgi:hypothetical protein
MAYIDGYGFMRDGSPPEYDSTNGAFWDPPRPTHTPPRLRARNVRYDVQYCPVGYWATKEGALVRITAMSDQHLENSIKFLERHSRRRAMLEAMRALRYASSAPEMAADAASEASNELFDMAHDNDVDLVKLAELVWPKYKELQFEKRRRGIVRDLEMLTPVV